MVTYNNGLWILLQIILTYINKKEAKKTKAAVLLERLGVDFKRWFSLESYQEFFRKMGILLHYFFLHSQSLNTW